MNKNIYTVNKINETTFQIDECGRDFCYLLLGEKRALLIDCSVGTGNLKEAVESLTDLPVTVAVTHAHGDHAGAGYQFGEIWVHESECNKFFRTMNTQKFRKQLISNRMKENGITQKDIKGRICDCKWVPFSNGHVFDLGGRTVKAVLTPGHSPGSVVFLDEKEKLMFTGDNTCPFLLMKVPFSTSLQTWLIGAEKTLELSKEYEPWCAHGESGKQTSEQIAQTIEFVKEIIEKHGGKNEEEKKRAFYPQKSFDNCVVYDTAKIV